MNARTFKRFPRSIELRAYIENNISAGSIAGIAQRVTDEMAKVLGGLTAPVNLTISSNRAGLHLAYMYYTSYHRAGEFGAYNEAVTKLQAAGWKECKGS